MAPAALKADHPGWLALKDGPGGPGGRPRQLPGQLRSLDLRGRTVEQKTTAGTVGALAVSEGAHPDGVAMCLELDLFPFAMIAAVEDSLLVLRPDRGGASPRRRQ